MRNYLGTTHCTKAANVGAKQSEEHNLLMKATGMFRENGFICYNIFNVFQEINLYI